jgi:DNA replication and repair protein RecF
LSSFGSRSEQRRAVLALKRAELEFVEGKIEERPVLLLDDIFSELDEENRGNVSEFLNDGQTILTTADLQQVPKEIREGLKIIDL